VLCWLRIAFGRWHNTASALAAEAAAAQLL